jgi:hypothetical protein
MAVDSTKAFWVAAQAWSQLKFGFFLKNQQRVVPGTSHELTSGTARGVTLKQFRKNYCLRNGSEHSKSAQFCRS